MQSKFQKNEEQLRLLSRVLTFSLFLNLHEFMRFTGHKPSQKLDAKFLLMFDTLGGREDF